ncbi:MAG: hypothetical protein ABI606_11995 [Rhodoferax sp.]
MKHFRFFLLLSLCAVGVWAQTAVGRAVRPEPAALEQRRAELRAALKALQEREEQGKDQMFENASAVRHLSAQERADLRQQLRQQRQMAIPDNADRP